MASSDESTGSARDRILSAALEVLERRGPAHLGIRGVASHARVSVGLVHHHFTSKDGLLQACLDSLFSALFAEEMEALAGVQTTDDLADALRDTARRGYAIALRHQSLVRVVKRIVAERRGLPPAIRTHVLGEFLGRWATTIAPRTGRPTWEVRAQLHSVVSLIGRYAVASKAELAAILDEPELSESELRERVRTHIEWLAASVATPA